MPRKKPRARRRRAEPPRPDHWPPLEREQHGGGTLEEGRELTGGGIATIRGRRAVAECILDYYRNCGHIDDRQWEAGTLVRQTGSLAALGSPVTASYGERVPGRQEMSDAILRARQRLSGILDQMPDAEQRVLLSVCVYDEPAGREMQVFRWALDGVAEYLKIPRD